MLEMFSKYVPQSNTRLLSAYPIFVSNKTLIISVCRRMKFFNIFFKSTNACLSFRSKPLLQGLWVDQSQLVYVKLKPIA